MIGKALIKNLRHCRDLLDKGYTVVFVYPFSSGDLPKHIKKLININDIFEGLIIESTFDEFMNLHDGITFDNGKHFAFKPEYKTWFDNNKSHYPIRDARYTNGIIYVRFDHSPDLQLANEILDS